MTRKLASIQKISAIKEIKGSDNILVCHIQGWQTVINKNENFNIGDKVIFVEIDAVLPEIPKFEFLRSSKFRIRTRKIRKVLSQGLCLPVGILPTGNYNEGDDVTELLGIKKHEPDLDLRLKDDVSNWFPSFIPKTDQPRLQSNMGVLNELVDKPLAITVKCDGSSMTCYYHDSHFGVCSRNTELKFTEANAYWSVAKKLNLEEKLKGLNLAIQGELCGPKIQGNKLKLKEHKLYVFDIFNIASQEYFNFDKLKEVCKRFELEMVPIVRENFIASRNLTLSDWLKMAEGNYENSGQQEGIVVRSIKETFSPSMQARLSFKIISNSFLMINDE